MKLSTLFNTILVVASIMLAASSYPVSQADASPQQTFDYPTVAESLASLMRL